MFVLGVLFLTCAAPAAAQRELWSIVDPDIVIYDLESGAETDRIVLPPRQCVVGMMSSDRRSYFIRTEREIGQFDVLSHTLVRAEPVDPFGYPCFEYHAGGATNKYSYWFRNSAHGNTTLQVFDGMTLRPLILAGPSTLHEVRFDMAGERAYISYYSSGLHPLPPGWSGLNAYVAGTGAQLWQRLWDPSGGIKAHAVGQWGVYLLGYNSVKVSLILTRLSVADGSTLVSTDVVHSFIPSRGDRIAVHDHDLYVLTQGILRRFDALTLDLLVSVAAPEYASSSGLYLDASTATGYTIDESTGAVHSFDPITLMPRRSVQFAPFRAVGFGELSVPNPPRLTAFARADRRVELQWQPDTSGATPLGYEIQAGLRSQPLFPVVSLDGTARSWVSPPLPRGSYEIELVPQNRVGTGLPSPRAAVGVDEARFASAPEHLVLHATDNTLRLTWQAPGTGVAPERYRVEAAPYGSETFSTVAEPAIPEFHATGVPPGTWTVRVRGVTSAGAGPTSIPVALTTALCTKAPSPPQSLTFSVSAPMVTLQWLMPESALPAEYVLEVGSSFGAADLLRASLAGTEPSVQAAAPPGIYAVKVRARNACGESGPSNEVLVLVPSLADTKE